MAKHLPDADRPDQRAQRAVVPDDLQALADLGEDAARLRLRLIARRGRYTAQQQRRKEERDRVDQDRDRRGEPMDERAGDARTHELRRGIRNADLRVRLDQVAASDTLGHEDLVGRPADDRARAHEESHDVEERHREHAEPGAHRHREQRQAAPDVGRDDDRQLRQAVDQHAGEQAEERERQRFQRGEDAHFERRGVQHQRRGERQREERDLAAEVRDRERAPQFHEVGIAPQAVDPTAGVDLLQECCHCSSFVFGDRSQLDGGCALSPKRDESPSLCARRKGDGNFSTDPPASNPAGCRPAESGLGIETRDARRHPARVRAVCGDAGVVSAHGFWA